MQLLNSIFSLQKISGPGRSSHRSHYANKNPTILCGAFLLSAYKFNMENSEMNSKSYGSSIEPLMLLIVLHNKKLLAFQFHKCTVECK